MKKYRFNLSTWATCPETQRTYRKILKDWIEENDGVKTPLYVKSDVYVWAVDKDMLHMVIESDEWDDLPSRLDRCGSDILDILIDAIDCRNEGNAEEQFLDYLCTPCV